MSAAPQVASTPDTQKVLREQEKRRSCREKEESRAPWASVTLSAVSFAALVARVPYHTWGRGQIEIPSASLWKELSFSGVVGGLMSVALGLAVARGWRRACLAMIPLFLALPFVLHFEHSFPPCGLFFSISFGVWKTIEVLTGQHRPAIFHSPTAHILHFASPIEFQTIPSGQLPSPPSPREVLTHVGETATTALGLSIVSSIRALAFQTDATVGMVGPQLSAWAKTYTDVWLCYLFFRLNTGFSSILLALGGLKPQRVWRQPLTRATSPSDFWARRWNLWVHGLFHRTVFLPASKAGCPPSVAALTAFAISGILHEFAFLAGCRGRGFGGQVIFFTLQALLVSAQKWLTRRVGVPALLQASPLLCILINNVLLLPSAPLFMWALREGGVLAEMEMLTPRLGMRSA